MTALPENSKPNSAVTTRAEGASGPKPGDAFLSQPAEVRQSSCIQEAKKLLLMGQPFSYVQPVLFNTF